MTLRYLKKIGLISAFSFCVVGTLFANTTQTSVSSQNETVHQTTSSAHKQTANTTKTKVTSSSKQNANREATKTTSSKNSAKTTTHQYPMYTFDFNPPEADKWQLVQNAFDPNGYARTYMLPQTGQVEPESVTISFGRNIHTTLNSSMQEVVDSLKKIHCQDKKSHVIKKQEDSLVFYTLINRCDNGKALQQIFKVFNTKGGQYSIIYSTDPRKTSAKRIAEMQQAVIAGKLVPIPKTQAKN